MSTQIYARTLRFCKISFTIVGSLYLIYPLKYALASDFTTFKNKKYLQQIIPKNMEKYNEQPLFETKHAYCGNESIWGNLIKEYVYALKKQVLSSRDCIAEKEYKYYWRSVMRCLRMGVALPRILGDYAWNYYIYLPILRKYYHVTNTDDIESRIHDRNSKLLCQIVLKNEGIYVKTGQTIANMPYLFPPEYINNLKPCLFSTLESTFQEVQYILEKDMGKPLQDIFIEFDKKPIASASLGQVHRAKLRTGEEVAVKIQHRGLYETEPLDMAFVQIVFKFISLVFPSFDYTWFAEEMSHNLPIELNFLNETENMKICTEMIKPYSYLKVPEVYPRFCSHRILTMSFEEGTQIDKAMNDPSSLTTLSSAVPSLIHLYLDMVFKYHYIHADPHGGNILVRNNHGFTELVILDHGLYHHLNPSFLFLYSDFILSIANSDHDAIRSNFQNILKEGLRTHNTKKFQKKFESLQFDDELINLFVSVLTDRNIKGDINTYSPQERFELQKIIYSNLRSVAVYASLFPIDLGFLIKTFDCIRTILLPYGYTTLFYIDLFLECKRYKLLESREHSLSSTIQNTLYSWLYWFEEILGDLFFN
ncbi:hypothetical protein WA158_008312 [Blastocystis sp. Blastoise]